MRRLVKHTANPPKLRSATALLNASVAATRRLTGSPKAKHISTSDVERQNLTPLASGTLVRDNLTACLDAREARLRIGPSTYLWTNRSPASVPTRLSRTAQRLVIRLSN